jgi:hypothetical protein
MPKLVCLLAATLMLVSGAANAHSWYPKECCHDNDCHPIPCSDIAVKNGQVIWNGVELSWPTVRTFMRRSSSTSAQASSRVKPPESERAREACDHAMILCQPLG